MSAPTRAEARLRRHRRVRKTVRGTAERPRLAVFRSNRHVIAQVIDDIAGRTLAAASTLEADVRIDVPEGKKRSANSEGAKLVGQLLAQRAKAAGVDKVVFDRGGFRYHGAVAAVADGAREEGLDF